MPSAEQLRSRLVKKLSELFQLDQPDLDFGFYRIMHTKAEEVQDFIANDLLKIVADAFRDVDEARKTELQADYEKAVRTARGFGIRSPEETEPVKKAKAALDAVRNTASAEADVYDHLFRFFERYYDDGDFISRRYYARETSGKAAPFAVPYNGEEIKLHWANADQYYIKSTEYFSNFTFDLRKAREIREQQQTGTLLAEDDSTLKVHFRVVEATEGEHGNIKMSEANQRFFILHGENPLAVTGTGELVVHFEYRPDPEKTGQENAWRDKRNAQAVGTILKSLQIMADTDGKHKKRLTEYLRLLKVPAPTENDRTRPVLAKYVNRYTARNTMDYFIHKDLGDFLRRELDFYIKNEVMRLDDIESADAPAVESYLLKIKVLRKIAGKLIDFLAQLEDFQKKLWLKKKFIVEANYCITLDRVPEELYEEIAANEAQREEWIKLFALDEIKSAPGGSVSPSTQGFSRSLPVEFLKTNTRLVLDTRFFDESFKARLLASIEDFDGQCDGLLIHSDNFQAINLLAEKYTQSIKLIYIDPPYNTDASKILYKNGYEHSSWVSLMDSRLAASRRLLKSTGLIEVAVDDYEFRYINCLLDFHYGLENAVSNIAVLTNPKGRDQGFIAQAHDYTLMYALDKRYCTTNNFVLSEEKMKKKFSKSQGDQILRELPLKRTGSGKLREDRPYMFFPFVYHIETKVLSVVQETEYKHIYDDTTNSFDDVYVDGLRKKYEADGYAFILPVGKNGEYLRWRWGYKSSVSGCEKGFLFAKQVRSGEYAVYQYDFADDEQTPKSLWFGERYDASSKGTNLLKDIIPRNPFDYPKSIFTVMDNVSIGSDETDTVLDYFAGSGTTGHAVISLNRQNGGKRKYILVEMGDYFDTVLKPRIARVIYSESWKDGAPTARHTGISHCFKYIRLESYEDTLNNLRFDENPERKKAIAAHPSLREDYMLRYLLDVETRGSQSLLNIDAFVDPCRYTLTVKKPGTDKYVTQAVDLIETFNYLIGLRVMQISVPQTFTATFKRVTDPELPGNQHTRLVVDGPIRQDEGGAWWFRKVQGWVPRDPAHPNNGQQEKILIVWRTLTGNIEQDNLMLDEWFRKNCISTRDFEFETLYVNGSNNLPNLKQDDKGWKVRLIEEEFMKRMWSGENA